MTAAMTALADTFGEYERAEAATEQCRCLVEYLDRDLSFEVHAHRLCHVTGQNPVDKKARRAFYGKREAVDSAAECRTPVDLRGIRYFVMDYFNQRHLRDRVEKMDADQAFGFLEH